MNGWAVAAGRPPLVVVLAPLLIGWTRLIHARLEGRAGAGIGQPWRDLRKLARKEPISPADAGRLFTAAPPVLVATSLLIAAVAPLVATTSAAGGSADLIAVVGLLLGTVALALAPALALTAAAVPGTVLGPLQPLLRAAAAIVGAP